MLKDYQTSFINIAINCGALRFGEFTLKSGRISPYFFNAGCFNSAQALHEIAKSYAQTIENADFKNIDLLFGPAYKGIPLATATAMALYSQFQRNVRCAFNRKEAKAHGEGGTLMGAEIAGDILIIDDVITAGTAVREVFNLLDNYSANIRGLVIGLDRQEKNTHGYSAVEELERQYNIKVHSIIGANDLLLYLEQSEQTAQHLQMKHYLEQYGSTN